MLLHMKAKNISNTQLQFLTDLEAKPQASGLKFTRSAVSSSHAREKDRERKRT